MTEGQFTYKRTIHAPVSQIFRAFTSATSLREWLCDVSTTNPEEGGRIYLAWNHGYFASGHFVKLIPDEKISFTWIGKNEPGWTHVDVSIIPQGIDADYLVELQHTGIGETSDWDQACEEIARGWKFGLDNLKSILEEGRDLRVVNRPLLGIYPEDVTDLNEAAKQALRIPVDYGILVRDVVVGYGAEKAGIKANDVIVAINHRKIDKLMSLGLVINKFEPGDIVEVDVFRGPDKLTLPVDTMPQMFQMIPETPEGLAKQVEIDSLRAIERIENLLDGITEEEASFSPGPEEWSVKEVLVHLIHSERDIHSWINDLVSGQERFYDEWPGDRLFRIRATLTNYPTVESLMAELRRDYKETVASIAFLELEFTHQKASYWRLGRELLGKTIHIDEHIQQIKNNIQAARQAMQI